MLSYSSIIPSKIRRVHVVSLSSSSKSSSRWRWKHRGDNENQERREKLVKIIVTSCTIFTVGYSVHTRKWREDHLNEVPNALNNGIFYLGKMHDQFHHNDLNNNHRNNNHNTQIQRDILALDNIITRTGLMGKAQSVKDELDRIRTWHQDNGYKGGIVLRELDIPLYSPETFKAEEDGDESFVEGGDDVDLTSLKPTQMKQRECYYLYYEIKPNGHTLQQIYCRGTTIRDDIYTCLQSRLVYDDALGIHVHSGFLNHANRLVTDVLPLLGPPISRTTVEVSGHSLGGKNILHFIELLCGVFFYLFPDTSLMNYWHSKEL